MKILIVNRFFGGAQIPTGRMAEDVARLLVEEGHEVTALASTGEYVGAARRADGIQHTANGIRLEKLRVPKWMPRALAWVWFTWQARQRTPRMDWDVCVLMTDPPLLPLLARRAAGMRHTADGIRENSHEDAQKDLAGQTKDRTTETPPYPAKRRIAVWLMDLYPEALAASGRIRKSNPIYKWYSSKRQKALGSADLLICLGYAQKELLGDGRVERGAWSVERGAKSKEQRAKHGHLAERVRTAVVPPWDDRENIALATEGSLKNLALYAGNLGEAHCFEEILAAAPYLPADWTIRFAARGAKLRALKAAASGIRHTAEGKRTEADGRWQTGDEIGSAYAFPAANDSSMTSGSLNLTDLKLKTAGAVVHVSGYASDEETPGLLASARVHLITMSPGWEGIVVPSKLYGCIRTGRPVLFIGPENADTAREILAHDWGKVLPPGASGEEVAAAILELAARTTSAADPRNGAREIAKLLETLATDRHG
jgi:hypothetical protein